MQENGLMKKLKLTLNFMASQTVKQIITLHILPNISRNKVNQAMKFVQFIEFNMRNIFLENSSTKCGEEASSRTFYKKSKLSISLNQQSEML